MPKDGYVWWYVDALSEDEGYGITIIAFIGSVFSPYYAWARRRGTGHPLRHCAFNVVLYGLDRRWAMTERGAASVRQSPTRLEIGPSALAWQDSVLTISIDERTAPVPGRIRGTVRVRPEALTGRTFVLDEAGWHRWSPLAPCAEVNVAFDRPALRWSGPGYFDSNEGDAPLENSFARWDWCRAGLTSSTAILYEATQRSGARTSLALRIDRDGSVTEFEPPEGVALPSTRWRIVRRTRADGREARVQRTLVDAPFYARSVLATRLLGEPAQAMHESLSLDRFRQPWVQAMLPFRMPRRG